MAKVLHAENDIPWRKDFLSFSFFMISLMSFVWLLCCLTLFWRSPGVIVYPSTGLLLVNINIFKFCLLFIIIYQFGQAAQLAFMMTLSSICILQMSSLQSSFLIDFEILHFLAIHLGQLPKTVCLEILKFFSIITTHSVFSLHHILFGGLLMMIFASKIYLVCIINFAILLMILALKNCVLII